jgi:signal transduction histidine kinase
MPDTLVSLKALSSRNSARIDIGKSLRFRRHATLWPWKQVAIAVFTVLEAGEALSRDATMETALPLAVKSGPFATSFDIIYFALVIGAVSAAMISAIWLIRDRARIVQDANALRDRLSEAQTDISRYESLISENDRCYVIWDGSSPPHLIGSLSDRVRMPRAVKNMLAFETWLEPKSAQRIQKATETLRADARGFDLSAETRAGERIEIHGRTQGGRAFLRFCVLSGVAAELAGLRAERDRLEARIGTIEGLVDSIDLPVWIRDADDQLIWTNQAFAKAVDAIDRSDAVQRGLELLGTAARQKIMSERSLDRPFAGKISTVVRGNRTFYEVTDAKTTSGSAGLAIDVNDTEAVRDELRRTVKAHAATLDLLAAPVAIFDGAQCLQFYNQAFQRLWGLDLPFLEAKPTNGELLERLRNDGKLPISPSWRDWKEETLSVYQSVDPEPRLWHLPDGQTLNVFTSINPNGGVTWVFENLTEKYDMESRYNTLVTVQGETIDHLAEGVCVFGADGRLRLSNPAFRALWALPEKTAGPGVHVRDIVEHCRPAYDGEDGWDFFASIVTGFDEERRNYSGRLSLNSGLILDYAVVPLPDAQLMLAFVNVTDAAMVERALTEKNEALRKADALKNDFVQHVSYELRSPLTNIIGFTDLLKTPQIGPLNERQTEYLDHISSSSSLLLTIVNDILDLATVDAGIMELDITGVDLSALIGDVANLFADRLKENDLTLAVDVQPDVGYVFADEQRVRQILFKLLGNAANFAPSGSRINLTCRRDIDEVVFAVADTGPGIPEDVLQTVFNRFESHGPSGRKSGAGLGLSIVDSFVKLHNGSVSVESREGSGTTVICRLPANPSIDSDAAE